MTRDLRRRVLESHKTVSKKSASRVASKTASTTNSRSQSRNISRHASDDDDESGSLSDDDSTTWSVNSLDDVVGAEEPTLEASDQDLRDRIEEIIDRKRSSEEGREATLMAYNRQLMHQYCSEAVERSAAELYPALCKSIRPETGEKEACLALRAIGLTVITCPSEDAYDDVFRSLKQAYQRSQYIPVKTAAIRTIAALATFGGAAESEIEEIMDEFVEVIESDGTSVDAPDSAEVVSAALEEWGNLATFIEDLEDKSQEVMEAFVDQLDSSSTSVRIAAGETIALLYEKSYTPREHGEERVKEENVETDDDGFQLDVNLVKRYEPLRQKYQLEDTLSKLAKVSSKSISQKERRTLHATFSDVLMTVKYPSRGPRYSTALDDHGNQLGSRMYLSIYKGGAMKIDKWWKLHRLQALKRVLGSGFMTHYEANEVVFESLPLMITERPKTKKEKTTTSKGLKYHQPDLDNPIY